MAWPTGDEELRAQQEREWREYQDKALAQGRCPDSGQLLSLNGEGLPGSASCEVCDCFGWDVQTLEQAYGLDIPAAVVYADYWEE